MVMHLGESEAAREVDGNAMLRGRGNNPEGLTIFGA